MLDLFNANVFGQPVFSISTLGREVNLLILLGTLLSPTFLAWEKIRRNAWSVFLVMQPPFVATSFIFSSYPVDTASQRYLVILPFYTAIIFALVLSELSPTWRRIFAAGFIVAAVCNMTSTSQAYLSREGNPNDQAQTAAHAVERLHLAKGYASYWNAGIDQYFTNNKVVFIQSGCSPSTGVKLSRELVNEREWLQPAQRSFYLFDARLSRCSQSDFVRFLGQPRKVVDMSRGRQLLIYDYDILSKMSAPLERHPGD